MLIKLFIDQFHTLGFQDIVGLINHPVHISNTTLSPSSFIPFCSFGSDIELLGEKLSNFQFPVCNLFREKIVDGQVCYETDLNQLKKGVISKKVHWEDTLHKGLSLIIDTNEEYDVKKLLRESEDMRDNTNSLDIFENSKKENDFRILLKTISK